MPLAEVHHLVEPRELVPALFGFEQGPGEDADADAVDAGLAHEPHVLGPRLAGPLLGVVVTAVDDGHGGAPSLGEDWVRYPGYGNGILSSTPLTSFLTPFDKAGEGCVEHLESLDQDSA
jgi:hypothetical protein